MAKNLGGRPTVMTPSTLEKLKEAFLMGMSDALACLHADIHPATLYNYCKEHPEYLEQKEHWKKNIAYKAVRVIDQSLDNGDVQTAKFVVERRLKDDWSTRTEQTGADGAPLAPPKIVVEFVGVKDN